MVETLLLLRHVRIINLRNIRYILEVNSSRKCSFARAVDYGAPNLIVISDPNPGVIQPIQNLLIHRVHFFGSIKGDVSDVV